MLPWLVKHDYSICCRIWNRAGRAQKISLSQRLTSVVKSCVLEGARREAVVMLEVITKYKMPLSAHLLTWNLLASAHRRVYTRPLPEHLRYTSPPSYSPFASSAQRQLCWSLTVLVPKLVLLKANCWTFNPAAESCNWIITWVLL